MPQETRSFLAIQGIKYIQLVSKVGYKTRSSVQLLSDFDGQVPESDVPEEVGLGLASAGQIGSKETRDNNIILQVWIITQ